MKKKLIIASLVLAAGLAALFAAQEIAPPVSAGANETVVLKKRARIATVHISRDDAIVFTSEVANIDNATDIDRKIVPGPQVMRPLTPAVLAETAGGAQTLAQVLAKLGDFQAKWRAEDIAAQTP